MKFYRIFKSINILDLIVFTNLVQTFKCDCFNDDQAFCHYEYEESLLEKLLTNYNSNLRPNYSVQIKLSLYLIQIIDIIEKDQIMILNAFIDHFWIDHRLSWDPAHFGNISKLRISGEKLWAPDTFIYTTADRNGFLLPGPGVNFVVNNNGEVFWPNPLTQLRVRCRMGILWFPFDKQLCEIVFGSWSYSMNYLNYSIVNDHPSLASYTENNVWTLLKYKPFRNEVKYDTWFENTTFSEVVYKILIKRKPLFVLQNCVVPSVMLCILTLVSFFIPFAPKMQIGMSIMLAFAVYKLRLSDDVPVQSDITPLINIYFIFCMTFSLAAMIWFSVRNVLVTNKYVPYWLRFIINKFICKIMFIKSFEHEDTKLRMHKPISSRSFKIEHWYDFFRDEESTVISRNNSSKNYSNEPSKISYEQGTSKKVLIQTKSNSEFEIDSLNDQSGKFQKVKLSSTKKRPSFNKHENECDSFDQVKNISSQKLHNCFENKLEKIPIKINQNQENNIDKKKFNEMEQIMKLIKILNIFIFIQFLIFIILLNVLCLFVLPYFFQESLSIDD